MCRLICNCLSVVYLGFSGGKGRSHISILLSLPSFSSYVAPPSKTAELTPSVARIDAVNWRRSLIGSRKKELINKSLTTHRIDNTERDRGKSTRGWKLGICTHARRYIYACTSRATDGENPRDRPVRASQVSNITHQPEYQPGTECILFVDCVRQKSRS